MDSKNLWAATQQVVDHAIQANRTGQVLKADFIRTTSPHHRLTEHCTVCLSLGRRSGLTQAALSRALETFPTRCLYTAPEYTLTLVPLFLISIVYRFGASRILASAVFSKEVA